jgi:hypothetical protein
MESFLAFLILYSINVSCLLVVTENFCCELQLPNVCTYCTCARQLFCDMCRRRLNFLLCFVCFPTWSLAQTSMMSATALKNLKNSGVEELDVPHAVVVLQNDALDFR